MAETTLGKLMILGEENGWTSFGTLKTLKWLEENAKTQIWGIGKTTRCNLIAGERSRARRQG